MSKHKLDDVLGFINSHKETGLYTSRELPLLWDYYKSLAGQRKLSEKHFELAQRTYEEVLEREKSGRTPRPDFQAQIDELKEAIVALNEAVEVLLTKNQ